MAIIDTILTTPVNVAGLRKEGKALELQLDGAFSNLVNYASKNWQYTASGSTGGQALLDGSAKAAPGGGIATALKLVFINGLGVAEKDIEYIRITGYLLTGPTYLCYDPQMKGNVRKLDGPKDYGNGCVFNEHYYLKCGNKYYDPCLSVAYAMRDQSIKERFGGPKSNFTLGGSRRLLVTANQKTGFLYMQEPVHGFQGSWVMFDVSKKNIEKAMGSQYFKAEMEAVKGTTSFATFVKSLHA